MKACFVGSSCFFPGTHTWALPTCWVYLMFSGATVHWVPSAHLQKYHLAKLSGIQRTHFVSPRPWSSTLRFCGGKEGDGSAWQVSESALNLSQNPGIQQVHMMLTYPSLTSPRPEPCMMLRVHTCLRSFCWGNEEKAGQYCPIGRKVMMLFGRIPDATWLLCDNHSSH